MYGKRQLPFLCLGFRFPFENVAYIYISIYCRFKGKRKPRRFSLVHLLFAHRANGSLLFVRLLTKKQTEAVRLQTDYMV